MDDTDALVFIETALRRARIRFEVPWTFTQDGGISIYRGSRPNNRNNVLTYGVSLMVPDSQMIEQAVREGIERRPFGLILPTALVENRFHLSVEHYDSQKILNPPQLLASSHPAHLLLNIEQILQTSKIGCIQEILFLRHWNF